MGCCLVKAEHEDVPCRFCGGPDGDGHLSWDCPCPPHVNLRNDPEFSFLVSQDRYNWPQACFGRVGFLGSLPVTLAPLGL